MKAIARNTSRCLAIVCQPFDVKGKNILILWEEEREGEEESTESLGGRRGRSRVRRERERGEGGVGKWGGGSWA